MVPLATGSDHGGSIRIPACYCGVVGHRATPGVVPFEERAMTQTFYSVQGPMARTVADTALLLSVIAGRTSGHDPMAFPLDATGFRRLAPLDVKGLRVGVSEDLGGVVVSSSVREVFRRTVKVLADHGAQCVQVGLNLADGPEVDWRLRADVFATYYHHEAGTWDDDFNPNIRATYDQALATPVAEIARARHRQMELYRHMVEVMADVDVIVCPGVAVPAFPWTDLYPTDIDGHRVDNYMAWLGLTSAVTVVGHPVTAVPAGVDDTGMPFGVQLIGPAYGDHRLLSVAAAIEPLFERPRPDLDALRSLSDDHARRLRDVR
jgi:Asp-tRNA(Asn)/Glu-tRNA(Gln) amidotransferase A subunit family amidase